MKKGNAIKILSALLLGLLLTAVVAGCNTKTDGKPGQDNNEDLSSGYPLKTDRVLTYWMINNPPVLNYTDRSEYPFTKELEARTGVKLKMLFPPIGQETQQLSILLASGDLPDMMEYFWYSFQGGPDKLINDGYAAELNELVEKNSPNLKKYLSEHTEIDKMIKTDAGKYFCYPALAEFGGTADRLLVTNGYMMRKDWLDDLGLEVPETIDEWYAALKGFKERKGADAPLTLMPYQLKVFAGAFGGILDFYQEDGIVKYGKTGDGYKEFLITMNRWYKEGLLDKNFANLDRKMIDSKMLGGQSGATHGWLGSWMGTWLNVASEKNMKFDLVGVPFPTMKKGEKPQFGTKIQPTHDLGVIITEGSKNKDLAARFLDYGYSEEGHLFFNFGTEGISYTMEDNYPRYTDLILKNPDKLSISDAMSLYCKGNAAGAFVQDERYIEQFYPLLRQKEAQVTWMEAGTAKDLPLLTPTGAESSEYNKIMSDIDTYSSEMMLKFIIGVEPMDNYDKYMSQMSQMGIEKAISLKQTIYDRYRAR